MNNNLTTSLQIAILAGGKNQRFGGHSKALMHWKGAPLLSTYLKTLKPLGYNLFVISNSAALYQDYAIPVYADNIMNRGPLSGIESALSHAEGSHVLMLACDMPLFSVRVIEILCHEITAARDQVIVPYHSGIAEPLFSIWPKNVLPLLDEWFSATDENKIMRFIAHYDLLHRKDIPSETANDTCFKNVNTPEDLNFLIALT